VAFFYANTFLMNRTSCLPIVILLTAMTYCQSPNGQNGAGNLSYAVLAEEIDTLIAEKASSELVFAVVGGGKNAFLTDKSGTIHKSWIFERSLGNDLKLLPSGDVLAMFKADNPEFTFGGGYSGLTQIISPSGEVLWQFEYRTADLLSHHESVFLPNGNLLMLAWERIPASEARKHGTVTENDLFPEKIIEVDTATSEIVWQWRSWDHIAQDKDPLAENYGDLFDLRNRIDINYNLRKDGDIMHANGLLYDEDRDLIFMSVNHYSEVWVIDHSTSSNETAMSRGGNYGVGGDLVYRFGNPETFEGKGEVLFDRVHNPSLIPIGRRGAGHLMVYNNGLKAKASQVMELELPEMTGEFISWQEPKVVWSFEDANLSYGRISGAERLSNGNTLICEGDYGFWEVTYDKEVVWKYDGKDGTYWRGYSIDRMNPVINNLGITLE
jgi:hypothetical protein